MGNSFSNIISTFNTTKIGDLVKIMDNSPIYTFIIGISSLKFHSLSKNIVHTAILLTTKRKNEIMRGKCNDTEGILIEYGNYPPDESEAKKEEEDKIKNGLVIYRYGDKGGLRYYTNTIDYFINNFCDVGYITLNISKDKQCSFLNLIDKLAPLSENKWIKENYNAIGINKKSQNSIDFVCHVIDILKPPYDILYIRKGKFSKSINYDNIESIIPDSILKTLKKYENDD